MNDNRDPEGIHHASCLHILSALREQLDVADKAGVLTICPDHPDVFRSEHFAFWRDQIDRVLTLKEGQGLLPKGHGLRPDSPPLPV
jgi:hypothetical protein